MEKDGLREMQLCTSDTPRKEIAVLGNITKPRFLRQPKGRDYCRYLSIKPPVDLEEDIRDQISQPIGSTMVKKALLRALAQEVEQEAAKIDIVRPAFIASRQLQTSMKTKGSSVLVDTRSYLLTVANSSQSRKQVAEEVSHLVVALNTKMQNLLDYSHAKRYRLQFKSKAIQTEIENRVTAIKAKKDQVRKLQTEIAEISSKVTEKPSGGGIGGGSMSSFYLQKLLNVTQDRSGKKSSPENRSLKSSEKDASPQSKSFMQQKTLNVFGKSKGFSISPTKAYIDAESEGSGYSIQIQGQIKSEPRPVVKQNTQTQDAYGVSQLSLSKHKSQISRDSQTRLAMIGLNKSYTMGMSPCSEGGKSSKCATKNGYGDYSFVEGSSKNIEIVENESDLGVIDKFSKWIQRIRPKY